MTRTVIVIIWTVLATMVLGIVAIIACIFSKTGDRGHRIAPSGGKSILLIGRRVRVDIKTPIESSTSSPKPKGLLWEKGYRPVCDNFSEYRYA